MSDALDRSAYRTAALTTVGALLTLAVLFFTLAPASAHRALARFFGGQRELRIGASEHTAQSYALPALADQVRGYPVVHIVTSGSSDNIARLKRGELDAAFVQGGLSHDPIGVGAAASIAEEVVHVIVPTDSPVRRFRDLAGRPLFMGQSGGGTRALAQALVEAFDLPEAPTAVGGVRDDLGDLFRSGRIEGAIVVARLGNEELSTLMRRGGFRLLALPEAAALSRALPGTFLEQVPQGTYGPGRAEPGADVPTLGVHMNLFVAEHISPAQLHALLDAVYSLPYQRAARLLSLTEQGGREAFDVPLHKDAEAFYRRDDPVSSDRFEIAAFFLGLLIALIGFVRYVADQRLRYLASRRRQRIRPFFEHMVRFAERLEQADADEVAAVHHEMMQRQREAEVLWLNGQLETEDMENLYAVYNARALDGMQRLARLDALARAKGERPGIEEDDDEEEVSFTDHPRFES